jgi:hypothetical protein
MSDETMTVTITVTRTHRIKMMRAAMMQALATTTIDTSLHPEVVMSLVAEMQPKEISELMSLPAAIVEYDTDWCVEWHDENGHLRRRVSTG